jgi:hypothetical protein
MNRNRITGPSVTPLRLQAKHIVLSVAVVGLLLLALLIEGQKAQAYLPDATVARVVGAPKATCTPRGCRYQVTCQDPTPTTGEPGSPTPDLPGCLLKLSLIGPPGFLTWINECIPDRGDVDGEGKCLPEAKTVILGPGETTNLKLNLLKAGRKEIKRHLKKGKRSIRGGWEAKRTDLDFAVQSEAEAETWDAFFPGFRARATEVSGYWIVFQVDYNIKIKLRK